LRLGDLLYIFLAVGNQVKLMERQSFLEDLEVIDFEDNFVEKSHDFYDIL